MAATRSTLLLIKIESTRDDGRKESRFDIVSHTQIPAIAEVCASHTFASAGEATRVRAAFDHIIERMSADGAYFSAGEPSIL